VIVPNLEDFRIDRVHLFKLSRHSPAAPDFPAADVSSVASIAKSSSKVPRRASNDNVCRTTHGVLISREDTQKAIVRIGHAWRKAGDLLQKGASFTPPACCTIYRTGPCRSLREHRTELLRSSGPTPHRPRCAGFTRSSKASLAYRRASARTHSMYGITCSLRKGCTYLQQIPLQRPAPTVEN
jgi:hypothetical protein